MLVQVMISQIFQPLVVWFVAGNCSFIIECLHTSLGCETFCTGKNQHTVIVYDIQYNNLSFILHSTYPILYVTTNEK